MRTSLLRIIAAFTFMAHGAKLFAFPAVIAPNSLVVVAGILETFGGGLMLVGFLTRPVAFLSGEMAACSRSTCRRDSGRCRTTANSRLYCFLWLYVAAVGWVKSASIAGDADALSIFDG